MKVTLVLTLALATTAPCFGQASQSDSQSNTVVVYGRALDLIGEAASVSEGVVDGAPINNRTHGHRQGFDTGGEVCTVIEVEPAQEILVGFAFA